MSPKRTDNSAESPPPKQLKVDLADGNSSSAESPPPKKLKVAVTASTSAAVAPVDPEWPANDKEAKSLNMIEYMPKIIAFGRAGLMTAVRTTENLKHLIPSDATEFCKLAPLDIGVSTAEKKETKGYKASWKKESCQTAISERSRYEAVANLDWLRAFNGDDLLFGDLPSFNSVDEIRRHHCTLSAAALASSQGGRVAENILSIFQ